MNIRNAIRAGGARHAVRPPPSPGRELQRRLRAGLALSALFVLAWAASPAVGHPAIQTAAPRAILLDFASGKVLFEKNADQPTAPASLAKLMTVAVVFDQLRQGRVQLEDEFSVSEQARRSVVGSTMGLRPGETVKLRDLLQGLIVQSANDAAVVLAEGLAGSVRGFATMMNERANEIGLRASRFTNPHGLPDPGQQVTMRDMALLAAHLIREYPHAYSAFGQREFTFNGTTYRNRNPLLGLGLGVDGLKTGQTARAGFALVASAAQDGRRMILALNGLNSAAARRSEAQQLLEQGLRLPAGTAPPSSSPSQPAGSAP